MPTCIQEISPEVEVKARPNIFLFSRGFNSFRGKGVQLLFHKETCGFSRVGGPDPPPSTGPSSAVGNVTGYRCVSDCRSRGREFDPGPVPYFRGD